MAAPVVHSKNDGQDTGSGDGITVTLTNAPQAGGLVVVLATIFTGSSEGADTVCTASGGSGIVVTERVNTSGTASSFPGVGIWTVEYTSAPTSIDIRRAGGTNVEVTVTCLNITGQTASYFDVAGSGIGSSTTPTATDMGDLTDATDLVLGVMTYLSSGLTIAPAANWTEVVEIDEDATNMALSAIQRTPGATGSYDPAWTLSSSAGWECAGIAIKGTAGGSTYTPRSMLLGVG